MGVSTVNVYGRISVADDALAQVVASAAKECYGVVELVSKKLSDSIADLLKKSNVSRGVKILTSGDRIWVDIFVILKYGLSIDAVAQSLRETVKYRLESFTGMICEQVSVNVVGISI
ncbi:MAG: Asp23/Gls24 family envelope stress response protein [Firmicutes bacterium]|nr:Asp23/Gls24 family envelope stress response protein [Bacillota bacterium]